MQLNCVRGGVCLILCLFSAGCGTGDQRIKTTPVSGAVTFQGQPVPEGSILFVPVQQGPCGQANLRKDGTFVAGTYEQADGLIPGEYEVMINGNLIPTDSQATGLLPDQVTVKTPPANRPLPDKYRDQKKSGLKAIIVAGQTDVMKFDLTP